MPLWLVPTLLIPLISLYSVEFEPRTAEDGLGVLAAIIVGVYSGAIWVAALVVGLAIRRARGAHRHHCRARQDSQIHW